MSVDNPELSEARLAATAAALAGDSGTLYHLVSGLLGEGVPFEVILYDLLAPTEQDVGARWQTGDYLVSEEHAATATVETVVALLAGSFDQPQEGVHVVVAAAEGDDHSLPARLAATHLLYLGYRTTYLGANVLASDLGDYLAAEPPEVLVLACAMTNHLVGARAGIRAGHAAGVPVIAGGRAFGEEGEWASVLGADAWAPTPRDVPQILDSWNPDPGVAEERAANPSRDLMKLMEQRAFVVAAAQRELASRSDRGDSRLIAEISLLLGTVEASLLVDDDRLITEMIRWQESTLAAHGYDSSQFPADSLRAALSEVSPSAERALSRAMGSERLTGDGRP